MSDTKQWYIVKRPAGTCEIIASAAAADLADTNCLEKWGPFISPEAAIAKRVGLIRAGKCQPV